jgi:hypothetical protein
VRTSSDCKASRAMLSSRNAWRIGTIRAAQRLPERVSNSAKTRDQSQAAQPLDQPRQCLRGNPDITRGRSVKKDGSPYALRLLSRNQLLLPERRARSNSCFVLYALAGVLVPQNDPRATLRNFGLKVARVGTVFRCIGR